MALSRTRFYREPGDEDTGGEERLRHCALAALDMGRGEHQLGDWAAMLDLGECATILAAGPTPLPAGGTALRTSSEITGSRLALCQ